MTFCQAQGGVPVCPDTSVAVVANLLSNRRIFFRFALVQFENRACVGRKFLWTRNSALQLEPCPAPCGICLPVCQHSGTILMHDTDVGLLPTIEMDKWRHTRKMTHSLNESMLELGPETKSWSIPLPKSGTAAARTAPVPSTKMRKYLPQEAKKYPHN